jgi:exosortase K
MRVDSDPGDCTPAVSGEFHCSHSLNMSAPFKNGKVDLHHCAQITAVLLMAVGLKLYYSGASVCDLQWILAPTAFFTESITGTRFEYEPYAGYMSLDRTFIIAAVCSGINFMIISFVMLNLRRLLKSGPQLFGWIFIPISAVIAYAVTIIANTTRISAAIWLRPMTSEVKQLSPENIHRLEGIIIYFAFLLLLFFASERIDGDRAHTARTSSPFRRSLFPLMIYYAATLGIPGANGAFREPDFREHFLFVLLTPLFVILPLAVLPYLRDNSRREKFVTSRFRRGS